MKQNWDQITTEQALSDLGSQIEGLSGNEAVSRLSKYGRNELPAPKTETVFQIFIRQFNSPLIYVLLAAAVIIFFINDATDALIIAFVLVFNAIVGTIQEGKAQNTLQSLRKLTDTNAVVIRDGEEIIVPDKELVIGDIVVLQEGDKIPADMRVLQSNNMTIDEAILTGESTPVIKIAEKMKRPNLQLAEQINMAFKGTNVVAGNGLGLVIATGINSHIGGISKIVSTIDTEDPLRQDIKQLSKWIIRATVFVCVFLLLFGVLTGKELREMFAVVVSLAISVIPEGLPIVMTLVLATGVWRMSKKNALVKKLSAVEALGQAQVIAVDKTGTITKNELTVTKIYTSGKFFEVTGLGFEPKGEVRDNFGRVDLMTYPDVAMLAQAAVFCANARVSFSNTKKQWQVSGDPTEAAMIVLGEKLGIKKPEVEESWPRIEEVPFSYENKYHLVVNKNIRKNTEQLSVAGAPETVLELCTWIFENGKKKDMTNALKAELEAAFNSMQKDGLRVIAFAIGKPEGKEVSASKLEFVGFLGLLDTLRPEIASSVAKAKLAGMKIVMITGDHPLTASALAEQAGIYSDGDTVLTGKDIESLSEEVLAEKIKSVTVFSRVTPDHKLKIIRAYQSLGLTIAMSGDGVNDAPSLVAADLGIAMGKIGTEVAKEASDIVLMDDNFESIIGAIEEGRSIFKTIKKVILYLFSTSLGEVLTIAGALIVGLPVPLLASQIIWLNFVTDGFLDVSLAMEPKEDGLLQAKFTKKERRLLDRTMLMRMGIMAIPMAVGALCLFSYYQHHDVSKALTVSLTVLAVYQWFNAWNCRNETRSIFKTSFFSNPYLVAATSIVAALQFLAVYHPFFQKILHTTGLNLSDWALIILTATTIIAVEEVRKLVVRWFYASQTKSGNII